MEKNGVLSSKICLNTNQLFLFPPAVKPMVAGLDAVDQNIVMAFGAMRWRRSQERKYSNKLRISGCYWV
jgi:hypothetical protein